MAALSGGDLPDSNSRDLVLRHPTMGECVTIWNNTSAAWIDSLTFSLYPKKSSFLTTVPLAKNGGMTTWELVRKYLPPGRRQILCSCESFLKHSLTSNAGGKVSDNVFHGIASVFRRVSYRHRGYVGRTMRELVKELYNWQTNELPCMGTALYSDMGKEYYTKLGWLANITNARVEIQPKADTSPKQSWKATLGICVQGTKSSYDPGWHCLQMNSKLASQPSLTWTIWVDI